MDAEEDPGEGETKEEEEEFPFDLCCCPDDGMPDDDILPVFSDDILTLFLRFGVHVKKKRSTPLVTLSIVPKVSSFPREFRFKEQIATKCIFRLTAKTKATT